MMVKKSNFYKYYKLNNNINIFMVLMIGLQDVFTIVIFFIPGYIALYFTNMIVCFDSPKHQIEKIIIYVLHSSISIVIYSSVNFFIFAKFIFPQFSTIDITGILVSAVFWGILYGKIIKLFDDRKKIPFTNIRLKLPRSLMASSNMFAKFHTDEWFLGGWVRLILKNGDIYKGFFDQAYDDHKENIHYIALRKSRKVDEKGDTIKASTYNLTIFNLKDVHLIEYYDKDFEKRHCSH